MSGNSIQTYHADDDVDVTCNEDRELLKILDEAIPNNHFISYAEEIKIKDDESSNHSTRKKRFSESSSSEFSSNNFEESSESNTLETKKSRQRGESNAAKERRMQRNKLFARESRRKSKIHESNLSREAEMLRFKNAMLLKSIEEVLDITNSSDDQMIPAILAIREVLASAGMKATDRSPALNNILKRMGLLDQNEDSSSS